MTRPAAAIDLRAAAAQCRPRGGAGPSSGQLGPGDGLDYGEFFGAAPDRRQDNWARETGWITASSSGRRRTVVGTTGPGRRAGLRRVPVVSGVWADG